MSDLRPVCACDMGYAGAACAFCAEGFVRDEGDECAPRPEAACSEDSCPANATCSDGGGVVSCTCNEPFVGEECAMCGPGFESDGAGGCRLVQGCSEHVCSGRGTCSGIGDSLSCECDEGFEGPFCDGLVDGCAAVDPCGDHGACIGDSGAAVCRCDVGYAGALCDECYAGYAEDDAGECVFVPGCPPSACSGAGTCEVEDGAPVCTCDDGNVGESCELCSDGYHRDDGGTCVVDETCADADPCGTAGTCVESMGETRCRCDLGYAGATCEECLAGFQPDGASCELTTRCDAFVCNGGVCAEADGAVTCSECPSGFSGDYCENSDDGCLHNACGSGQCVDLMEGSLCLCLDGTFGEECP